MRLKFTLLVLALSLLVPTLSAGAADEGLVLVRQGHAAARIVLGEKASSTEQYAAGELQRAIRVMSGGELPIGNGQGVRIVIGTPATSSEVKQKAGELGLGGDDAEKIVARTDRSTLYLAGNTPRGALYATYAFLEEVLGARWYWPGEDGEYLPHQPTIALPKVDLHQVPAFQYRGYHLCGEAYHHNADVETWMARNRMNIVRAGDGYPEQIFAERRSKGIIMMFSGHNMKLGEKLFAAHPDYFAMIDGKRLAGGQPCLSNPQVQHLMAQRIASWWDAYPELKIISLFPADDELYCQCPACHAMGDISTRWQKFLTAVIDEVNKTHPNKTYWTIAYQGYRQLPKGKVAPVGNNEYCAYNRCNAHLLDDPINQKVLAEIAAWQKKGAPIGIYDYVFDALTKPMFLPLASVELDQLKTFHQMGIDSVIPEIATGQKGPRESRSLDCYRFSLYAAAKGMWNPQVTESQLLDDWTTHVYGPAAPAMKHYYLSMERSWNGMSQHVGLSTTPLSVVKDFITPKLLQSAETDFTQAKAAAATVTDTDARQRIQDQIVLEERMMDNWRKLIQLREGDMARWQASALHVSQTPDLDAKANNPAWKDIPSLPAFIDAHGKAVKDPTDVKMIWTDEALYLRFICHDGDMGHLTSRYVRHDDKIWSDDCVEIFFNSDATRSGYMQLVVNPRGGTWDARSPAVRNMDVSWNPQWTAKASVNAKAWVVDVELPFASFGDAPHEGSQWRMALKRSRSATGTTPNSGWPDASYHSPGAFGTVRFVHQLPAKAKHAVIFAPKGDLLAVALRRLNWQVDCAGVDQALFARQLGKGCDVVLLYCHDQGLALKQDFLNKQVQDYLLAGGTVIVSARRTISLEKWFPQVGASVKWSGYPVGSVRKTAFVKPGAWQQAPHDLGQIFASLRAPLCGQIPASPGWDVLASVETKEGGQCPYLVRRPAGKGQLFVTSAFLGVGGGYLQFGNKHISSAAMLIDNLVPWNEGTGRNEANPRAR
jgi:hypothetical protein